MRRSLKRRYQSRNASADNDGRAADMVYVGGHIASMRSIADPDPRPGVDCHGVALRPECFAYVGQRDALHVRAEVRSHRHSLTECAQFLARGLAELLERVDARAAFNEIV